MFNDNKMKIQAMFPIRQYPTVKDEIRNLFSNTVGITFHLAAQHLVHGRLKVIIQEVHINNSHCKLDLFSSSLSFFAQQNTDCLYS